MAIDAVLLDVARRVEDQRSRVEREVHNSPLIEIGPEIQKPGFLALQRIGVVRALDLFLRADRQGVARALLGLVLRQRDRTDELE